MEKKRDVKEKGFTLAELIISISILLFALLTILGVIGSSIASIKKGENHLVAVALAQQQLEIYRNALSTDYDFYTLAHYNDLPDLSGKINGVEFRTELDINSVSGPEYPVSPSNIVPYSTTSIKKISVTIHWKENAGGRKKFKLTTYVNRN